MTNQDVIDMVSLGLPDDVIIEKIQTVAGTDFDTSVTGLRALKAGGVSDSVIRVVINPSVGGNSKLRPISQKLPSAMKPHLRDKMKPPMRKNTGMHFRRKKLVLICFATAD